MNIPTIPKIPGNVSGDGGLNLKIAKMDPTKSPNPKDFKDAINSGFDNNSFIIIPFTRLKGNIQSEYIPDILVYLQCKQLFHDRSINGKKVSNLHLGLPFLIHFQFSPHY